MAGSSIFDYVHQGDHAEVAEQLGLSLTGHSQGMASPSSSDDGTTHGTMNPDGDCLLLRLALTSPLTAFSFIFPVSSSMSIQSNIKYKGFERSFCIRMKSTLTKRGCQFKQSTGHRVSESELFISGRFQPPKTLDMSHALSCRVKNFLAKQISSKLVQCSF